MFCEKCGKEITGFEKVCPGCGENIHKENESVIQPATQADVEYGPACTQAPAKSKKQTSKKTTTSIIASAVVAVAIVVALVIVAPMFNSINLKNYITLNFYSSNIGPNLTLYDGDITAELMMDFEKFETENEANYNSSDSIDISDILRHLTIEMSVKGSETTKTISVDNDIDPYFENLFKDDVVVVTIDWPDDEETLKLIEQHEIFLGLDFWTKDTTFEIKVSDVIEKQGFTVTNPV